MNKVLLLICMLLLSCSAQPKTESFELVNLTVGSLHIEVQLAATEAQRAQGLMFQTSADPGMLLLYDKPQRISLWMRNTSMPLDVAFIDANWEIIRLVELEPFDETPVSSDYPVIAALELPRGWFKERQIGVGTTLYLARD